MKRVIIKGTGSFLPEKVLTNYDLEKMVDTSDEWITQRTGIKERRIVADDQSTSDMAAAAGIRAIENAGLKKDDIDYIIVATITPDYMFPSTAALVGAKLDIAGTPCIDIEAACSGFLYGIDLAEGLIRSGKYKNILVIAAESLTRIVDWEDRATCVLFGDGAGAAVLTAEESEEGIISSTFGADGNYTKILNLPAGGSKNPATEQTVKNRLHYIQMAGNETFKVAVKKMGAAAETVLHNAGLTAEDVKWLVPHQANYRIMAATAKRIKVPEEKVFMNLDKYGNTSAATIPIALDEMNRGGKLVKGDNVVLVAFGGGLTWGSVLLKWAK